MDCTFIKENLFAIAESTLHPDIQAVADKHLQSCTGCQQLVDKFRSINDSIAVTRSLEPDPFVSTRIIAGLESRYLAPSNSPFVRNRFYLRPVLLGLLLGSSIFSGILLGQFGVAKHDQVAQAKTIESLRSELNIHELTDEDIMLIANP
jgi:hypothetical protein